MARRTRLIIAAVLVVVAVVFVRHRFVSSPPEDSTVPAARVLRSALVLRGDQRLYEQGSDEPFNGLIFEDFPKKGPKLEIEIEEGKAHGYSRGWFENGQMEVDETFVEGVSNGRRTRWYASGQKRSEVEIIEGLLEGTYLEWHENGEPAVEMSLKQGVPHGPAMSWYPSGERKSQLVHEEGKVVERQSWPAPESSAATIPQE